jgi:hypothetical protein
MDTPNNSKVGSLTDIKIEASFEATVKLGDQFFQAVGETVEKDAGYVFATQTGFFGSLEKGGKSPPNQKAFAHVLCGTLDIYEVNAAGQSAFTERATSINLASPEGLGSLKTIRIPGHSCVHVKTDSNWLGSKSPVYFCIESKEKAAAFVEALNLQLVRFKDAAKRVGHATDATWFRELDIRDTKTYYPGATNRPSSEDDVVSPLELWGEVVDGFFPKSNRCCCLNKRDCSKLPSSQLVSSSNPFKLWSLVCPSERGYRNYKNYMDELPLACKR